MLNGPHFNHLRSEIQRLTDEQIEALRKATFGGMTEDEVLEYDNRGKQLTELVNEFRVLSSKRNHVSQRRQKLRGAVPKAIRPSYPSAVQRAWTKRRFGALGRNDREQF